MSYSSRSPATIHPIIFHICLSQRKTKTSSTSRHGQGAGRIQEKKDPDFAIGECSEFLSFDTWLTLYADDLSALRWSFCLQMSKPRAMSHQNMIAEYDSRD